MAGADEASPNGDATVHSDQSSTNLPPSKRRRTAAATTSSRGVANLTPEQLARKRANDREAQRAIRERTKNQIDRLNNRIRELESQQPYHDLQLVIREKDAIQAENAEIRKRLENVISTLQSMLQPTLRAPGGLDELAAAAERNSLPIVSSREPSSHSARVLPSNHHPHEPAPPQNGLHTPAEPGRQWLFPGDAPTSNVRRWSGDSPQLQTQFEHPRPPPPHIQSGMPHDARLGVGFLLDNVERNVDPNLHPVAGAATGVVQQAPSLVPHLTLPRNVPPTCPLDTIMLDFLVDRRARAAEGTPIKPLVGPLYPNFTTLVYPDRNIDAHELSKIFTDILRTFPDIYGLPEQVAIVFIMFLIMRWQIEPTQENYDRLPDWITPRASQLFVPHPCWVDYLPWPRLRDRIIGTTPFTTFDTFFIPFTTTVSLNWPYEPRDCLLPASKILAPSLSTASSIHASSPYSTAVHAGSPPAPPTPGAVSTPGTTSGNIAKDDEQWSINPAFESHLRDLRNWSLGPDFRSAFPTLAECVKIKEGR